MGKGVQRSFIHLPSGNSTFSLGQEDASVLHLLLPPNINSCASMFVAGFDTQLQLKSKNALFLKNLKTESITHISIKFN